MGYTSHPTRTWDSSNMLSLKLGFVCVLFILGSEAAPKPKPAPQYGDWYMNPNPAPQYGDWYMNPRPGRSCTDKTGAVYKDGESWACADGCNRCRCSNGVVTSTRMRCNRVEGKSCTDKTGAVYKDGESRTCADGCNRCWCSNGFLASTMKACRIVEGNPCDQLVG